MALFPDYATLAEARDYTRVTIPGDTIDDTELQLALTAASRAVDYACSRQFGLNGSAVARVYTPYPSRSLGLWCVDIDDLMTQTGLVVKSDLDEDGTYELTYAGTDYRLYPYNAAGDLEPWERILFRAATTQPTGGSGSVEVTANWGWSTVPATIKEATLVQTARFYKRRDAPFGIAGSPTMGGDMRLLAKLDPDVWLMVQPYARQAYV